MVTIVHVIDNASMGGAQTMMCELYLAFQRYYPEYDQSVLTLANRPTDKQLISSYGVEYREIKQSNTLIDKIAIFKKPVVIFHKLASSRLDIVQGLKNKSIPVIVLNHTLYNSRNWAKADGSCCNAMVAVSNHMEKCVRNWFPRIKRYTYIHNGVNQFRYEDIKGQKREKDTLVTGRINRICGWKHSEHWINWVKDVNLPMKMIHDYMGAGLNHRPGARGRERVINGKKNIVRMIGNISDFDTKVSIIKGWDLFLYETNREEGISMAILEALACGVPVICSNHFGNKEVIEQGVNGYIFRDRTEAKKILTRLCKNPGGLAKLKESTKDHFLRKLDARHTASRYIKIIDQMSLSSLNNNVSELSVDTNEKEKKEVVVLKNREISKKFTILSSCFNKGKYFNDWANSILEQKYRPLEVVVANDASTDNSMKLLEGFADKFKSEGIEYRLINNFDRLHCGSSYRNLVQYVTGSYVGVLDSDDMLTNDAVKYVMGVYDRNQDIDWIYTQFEICDMNMKTKRRGFCNYPKNGESLLEMGDKRIHGYGHWRTFSHKIKKPAKLFGRSLICSVDKHMGYRLEEMGPGLFVDRVCYRYRQHPVGSPESVSSTKKAIEVWAKVRKDAHKRRHKSKKKGNISYYSITKGK